mgnify:CR=1 FL=1
MTNIDHAAEMAADYTAAWNSGSAEAGNGGGVLRRRSRSPLTCDSFRRSGDHALFVWTFTGHYAANKAPLKVHGWEEWELDHDLKVTASRGWFDAVDYERQTAGA